MDKIAELEKLLADLRKQFGDGIVMKLGDDPIAGIDVIPTGSLALDIATGVGGVPRGRITEIFGFESSGKSTLCQHIIAEAQKMGEAAAFIDVEHCLELAYAEKCGINVSELHVSQPDSAEQALQVTEAMIRSGLYAVIVMDSVAALVPEAEIEGQIGDSHIGLQARLMSQALRKIAGAVKESNTAVVFTNQIRQKIGVMWGSPNTTSGGLALRFYTSIRIELFKKESIKTTHGEVIGNVVKAVLKKNKVAPPFKIAEFDIMYATGIDRYGDLLSLGVDLDIVTKAGAYYSYGETRLGQGKSNSREFLIENPEIAAEIEEKIRAAYGLKGECGDGQGAGDTGLE